MSRKEHAMKQRTLNYLRARERQIELAEQLQTDQQTVMAAFEQIHRDAAEVAAGAVAYRDPWSAAGFGIGER
jgi:hypothetical protein